MNKDKLIAIGEALIDFMPAETGAIKNISCFMPAVGGAPANVCGAFSKLGGKSEMITQLGNDSFGDKIVEEFKGFSIGCEYILRTDKANTSLSFVSLKENGKRDFIFYRNPGADMLLNADSIKKEWFDNGYALHFCSVSLGNFPMREAHKKAIEYAENNKMLISFDPNLRPSLWNDSEEMLCAVRKFIPKADILKISDEEIEQITGISDINRAVKSLFTGRIKLIFLTLGKDGAAAYTKSTQAYAESPKVKAVDTTGAGDGFIGAVLYKLYTDGITPDIIDTLSAETLYSYLSFANKFCSLSIQKKGAVISYPTNCEIMS